MYVCIYTHTHIPPYISIYTGSRYNQASVTDRYAGCNEAPPIWIIILWLNSHYISFLDNQIKLEGKENISSYYVLIMGLGPSFIN